MSSRPNNPLLFGVLVLLPWGCSKDPTPAAEARPREEPVTAGATDLPDPAPNPAREAGLFFKTRCSVCHGESGHGDGPGSAALNPKPRNYTDVEWQKSVTDEQIQKTILYGGAAVGKSPIMPASPELSEKPAVVAELVKMVRGFAKP